MYHVETIDIKMGTREHAYLDFACLCANNMYNVANYYIRNLMTGLKKDAGCRTPNEEEVIRTVRESIPVANAALLKKYELKVKNIMADKSIPYDERLEKAGKVKHVRFAMPTAEEWFAGCSLLDTVFRYTDNLDYTAHHSHLVQNAIKDCTEAWSSFFKQPIEGNGMGRKHIPGYRKKGGRSTAVLSNVACVIKHGQLLFPFAKFPGDDKRRRIVVSVSRVPHASKDKLIEVRVVPYFGSYQIQIVTDDGIKETDILPDEEALIRKDGTPAGVMMLDPGLTNFATMTDNKGNAPIIIKGGALKARNQWFNKQMAYLKSEQMRSRPKNERSKTSLPSTKRMHAVSRSREAFIKDSFYKYAHFIFRTMQERGLTYLIVGNNNGQKQNIHMGTKNNQAFVSVPFVRFNSILAAVAPKYGIRVIIQEESYTSKACFAAKDVIPVYGEKGADKVTFSGSRVKRGLYKQKDGKVLNADVNGSANIGRKYDERIFSDVKDLSYLYGNIAVITHADIAGKSACKTKRM